MTIMTPHHVWIDCDPGIDDAFALKAAYYLERLGIIKVHGVSVVHGNVGVEQAYSNAYDIIRRQLLWSVPLYCGMRGVFTSKDAKNFHGSYGLGRHKAPDEKPIRGLHALVDALTHQKLHILALGPLSNIAHILSLYPQTISRIKRVVWMGGSSIGGNVTPHAEFNAYIDPVSAMYVIENGPPMHILSLDVGSALPVQHIDKGSLFWNNLMEDLPEENHQKLLHDIWVMAYMHRPEMFATERAHIRMIREGSRLGHTKVLKNQGRHRWLSLASNRACYEWLHNVLSA